MCKSHVIGGHISKKKKKDYRKTSVSIAERTSTVTWNKVVREIRRSQAMQASKTLFKDFLYPKSRGQKNGMIRFIF